MYTELERKKENDQFWYEKPEILWDKDRLAEFFPSKKHSVEEKFNALFRLSIYVSIILYFYHNNPRYILLAVAVAVFTFYMYTNNEKKDVLVEGFEGEGCVKPTLDNPFMNVTMKDYMNGGERNPACNPNDPEIKKEIDEMFNNNLFKDTSDIFGKMNSQRQFYTMPWTQIPNNQGDFANYLYKNPKTCKEDQNACTPMEDLRAKRPIQVESKTNPLETK